MSEGYTFEYDTGGVEEMIASTKQALANALNASYQEKFISPEVKEAREAWHRAAIEVETALRVDGERGRRYAQAKTAEESAHRAYLAAKTSAGIYKERRNED